MRVHDNPAGNSVGRPQDDVRCFSRHAWQRKNLLHRSRNFSAKVFKDALARPHHGLGLVAEESCRPNLLLQFAWRCVRKSFRVGILLEQGLGDLIHTHVRALRRKNRSNQQFKRAFMIQFTGGVGIRLVQLRQNGGHTLWTGACRARRLCSLGCPCWFRSLCFRAHRFLLCRFLFLQVFRHESPDYSMEESAASSLRKALPRWLCWFFSSGKSSAKVFFRAGK